MPVSRTSRGKHGDTVEQRTAANSHRVAVLAVCCWFLVIGSATLLPENSVEVGSGFCLICGSRGLADAILNLSMFFPLGLFLRFAGLRTRLVVPACFTFSLSIELAQISLVAGRDATAGDIVTNTLGGLIGAMVASVLPQLLRPSRLLAGRLLLVAGLVSLAPAVLFAVLLVPSPGSERYWGQWNHQLGRYDAYAGRVLEASLGNIPVPPYEVGTPAIIRRALEARRPLTLKFTVAPQTASPATLFSIGDEHEREVLWIAIYGQDLLVRWRMRAADLRLDRPSFRLNRTLEGIAAGQVVSVKIEHLPDQLIAEVDGHRTRSRFRSSAAWTLLWQHQRMPPRLFEMLSVLWMALLTIPVAYWSFWRGQVLAYGLPYLALQGVVAMFVKLAQPQPLAWLAMVTIFGSAMLKQCASGIQHKANCID